MATMHGVDTTRSKQPVVASGEIEIAAAPDVVWETLTGFDRWPEWNPEVRSMSISGPAAAGTTFRWRAGTGTITSTIQRFEPTRAISWTGKTLGIRALNSWLLQPRGANTIVWEEETFDGLVARLFRAPLQKSLDRSLHNGLHHLKAEAEWRASGGDELSPDLRWTVPGAFRRRPSLYATGDAAAHDVSKSIVRQQGVSS
jgi:hypothetical protein